MNFIRKIVTLSRLMTLLCSLLTLLLRLIAIHVHFLGIPLLLSRIIVTVNRQNCYTESTPKPYIDSVCKISPNLLN